MNFKEKRDNRSNRDSNENKGLSTFFASCPREMEGLLEEEILDHGITNIEIKKGGILFKTDDFSGIKFLLNSRIASRVYKSFAFLKIKNERDLYEIAKTQPWEKILDLKQTFKITTLFDMTAKSFFKNSIAVSQILKDALVDHFRDIYNERPSVDTENPDMGLLLRLESPENKNGWNASIFIDMCGDALSNRGYRKSGHQAPLRENLAAAIVLSTDWNPEEDLFIDTMCGTGTLLIEAILIKGNIPPTYLRVKRYIERNEKSFAFLKQKWFLEKTYVTKDTKKYLQDIYNHCLEAFNKLEEFQFFGNDIDKKNLDLCEEHLFNAWIPDDIVTLSHNDATRFCPEEIEAPGVVICNPPYGERMNSKESLEDLYHNYGENLKKNYKGFRGYIFTSDQELRKKIALQTSKRIPFYNGNIECRLLRYELR